MATPPTSRRPVFFWQAVFILLPVMVLAVVSLVSLRQDERAAEQDARNRAAENVQSLARALRLSVNGEVQRFLTLQNVWLMGIWSASQPGASLAFPDAKLKEDIARWELDYPGIKLAAVAASGEILADGRAIEPPDFPQVPEPPEWYIELSPEQKAGWEALRSAENARADPAKITALENAFLATHPLPEAQEAARYLSWPPEQRINGETLATESGISFQELACFRLLSAPGAQLSGPLLSAVWQQSFKNPSFLTARLLNLSEAVANRTGGSVPERVDWMQQLWNVRGRSAGWLASLRQLPELQPWRAKPWSRWTQNDEALAIFEPVKYVNAAAKGGSLSGDGYKIWLVPRAVVAAIFARALAENQFLVPQYARPAVMVDGIPLISPAAAMGGDLKNLLGDAGQKAGSVFAPEAVGYEVQFYLTSREQMLSAERRRAKLFSWLILGTVFAAMAGLLAAWRAFRRQLELNELKSNFVSSVSHELRAPIAAVRLMAENLEHGKVPEPGRQNEYFRFIVQECRRLSSLIENVLDFSRIEQGRKQYEFEPTDLGALTQTTVKLMEPYAAEKGVRLELLTGGEPAANLEMNIDGHAIQQALVNLVDNAVKHSAKGQAVQIKIEKTKNTGGAPWELVCLSVTDQGPGIPSGEQEKIFERFYRLGSELRRETQGVGIGLSVVKHIVEAHGGRVRVESEPGRGSRFTIELPVKP